MISPPRLDLKEIAFVQRVLSVLLWWSKGLMFHDVKYSMKTRKNCNFQSLPDGLLILWRTGAQESKGGWLSKPVLIWCCLLSILYIWPGKINGKMPIETKETGSAVNMQSICWHILILIRAIMLLCWMDGLFIFFFNFWCKIVFFFVI